MAKNNTPRPANPNDASRRPAAAARPPQPAAPPAPRPGFRLPIHVWMAAGIVLVTWLFLQVCTSNQLTNWDDPGYIKDNALIKDLSSDGLRAIFSTSIMGNYHPLTILSYAIEYSYVRLDPWLYHLDSLLLHIGVTLLVYWFVQLLTRRPVAAAVAALLFGLHPMHIESVAWLAGRKDVVYGLFYMGACIAWVYYLRRQGSARWLAYGAAVVLFICSLLGKPVAVVLPLSLFLIDYFEKRRWSYWVLADKAVLFAISVYFGLRSVADQKVFGSLNAEDISFNFIERIALGAYAFCTYLWKAVAPAGLCNFYPYPIKTPTGALPGIYYSYLVIGLVIAGVIAFLGRRSRVVVFGSLFFLVNIVLLLQFIPVGGAIVADRYSYIAYLGLFFMAGVLVSHLYYRQGATSTMRYGVLAAAAAYIMVLGSLAHERCKVWYDTTTLWRDEIEKEPHDAPNAWNNLGFNYFNKYNESINPAERKIFYDSSYYCLSEAIRIQPTFVNPHISMGELQRTAANFDPQRQDYYFGLAKQYYYKALTLKSFDEAPNAYLGLAIIYAITHRFDSSAYCFRQATTQKPHFPEAQSNFGNFYDMVGQPDSALVHYGLAISQNPDLYAPHLNRGRLLTRMKRLDEAMKDFEIALALNPGNGEVEYAMSFVYSQRGDKAHAMQMVQSAIAHGFTQVNGNYVQSLK